MKTLATIAKWLFIAFAIFVCFVAPLLKQGWIETWPDWLRWVTAVGMLLLWIMEFPLDSLLSCKKAKKDA